MEEKYYEQIFIHNFFFVLMSLLFEFQIIFKNYLTH